MSWAFTSSKAWPSIVDGSRYSLDSSDDSDSSVYAMVGTRVAVRDLMYHMITRSSNLATNALIALVGAKRTTAAMRSLGAEKIQVLRGVEDQKAYERGLNNTTTARDLAIKGASLLLITHRCACGSTQSCGAGANDCNLIHAETIASALARP